MELRIDGWETGITFSASHFIPRHRKCNRLHGHVYAIHARIRGRQDEDGIVMDFLGLKEALRKIAEEMDHKVLLPKNSKLVQVNVEKNVQVKAEGKQYSFPPEDVAILDVKATSAEEVARFVLSKLVSEMDFPDNVEEVEIGVDEGRGQGAWIGRKI